MSLDRIAVRWTLRLADKFRSAPADRVFGMAVEAPLGIHRVGALVFYREAPLGLVGTVLRRPESVGEFPAVNSIQRRYVHLDARRDEQRASIAPKGNFGQALAQGLQQRCVRLILAIVAMRAAGDDPKAQQRCHCREKPAWVSGIHPPIMPSFAALFGGDLRCVPPGKPRDLHFFMVSVATHIFSQRTSWKSHAPGSRRAPR